MSELPVSSGLVRDRYSSAHQVQSDDDYLKLAADLKVRLRNLVTPLRDCLRDYAIQNAYIPFADDDGPDFMIETGRLAPHIKCVLKEFGSIYIEMDGGKDAQIAALRTNLEAEKKRADDFESELERHATDRVNQRKELAEAQEQVRTLTEERDALRRVCKREYVMQDQCRDGQIAMQSATLSRLREALGKIRSELWSIQERVDRGQRESAFDCIGLQRIEIDAALSLLEKDK